MTGCGSRAAFTGVLDDHTSNIAVALSLTRRLLTSYTGALFRVRRDADDAEQDIGYLANGDVDTSALQTFVGSDNAFVTTVYRQDGSSDHLIQSTTSSQPRIALAGVIDDGLQFAAGQMMQIPSAAQSAYTDGTNIQVLCEIEQTADGRMFDFGPDNISAWFPLAGTVYLDLPYPAGRVSAATPGGLTGSWHVCSIEREGATVRLRTDGSVDITGAAGGSISATSIFMIGATTGGSGAWTGSMRNFIIWKDCASPAARAALLA